MAKAFPKVPGFRPARTSTDSNQMIFSGQHIDLAAGDLTVNKLLGDIRAPKGAELLGVHLQATDLDSGALLMFTIGDAVDPARFMAANAVGQNGGLTNNMTPTLGYVFTEETLVQVKVSAAATGGGLAGSIKYGIVYVSN